MDLVLRLFRDADGNWICQETDNRPGFPYVAAEDETTALLSWLEDAVSDAWATDSPVRKVLAGIGQYAGRIIVERDA